MATRNSVKERSKPDPFPFHLGPSTFMITFIALVCAGLCYFGFSELRMGKD